jgi:hypothetical protein
MKRRWPPPADADAALLLNRRRRSAAAGPKTELSFGEKKKVSSEETTHLFLKNTCLFGSA